MVEVGGGGGDGCVVVEGGGDGKCWEREKKLK
jgi:hypothetical protein